MIKRQLITVLSLMLLVPALAQEGLKPLTGRINCAHDGINRARVAPHSSANKTQAVSLQLPFFDDFYYAATQEYPDMNLWSDSSVYVNTGFAIAPPSIGVATFDGLNKAGYPHKADLIGLTQSRPADTLTSRPIDLHVIAASSQTLLPSDSVALSFRYQARGRGEAPEAIDSLLLDLFAPLTNKWVKVWGRPGNMNGNINDTIFKRAYIKIVDASYLADGFRFRFRNKATTSGDFDHWHVDYVYLNKGRTIADTVFNDITIGGVPAPLLKNYAEMPWQQYHTGENAQRLSVRIKNNNNAPVPLFYESRFSSPTVLPAWTLLADGGNDQLNPTNNSFSTYTNQSSPQFTFSPPAMSDSTDFIIKHYVYRSQSGTSDFFTPNDTVVQYQRFRNYYALDDGSAEAGYYVNGIGGRMAVKIGVNVRDTLQALRIYFDPDGSVPSAVSAFSFVINVWGAGPNGPGGLVYTDVASMTPKYYNTGSREYPEYKLSSPQVLPAGTYYVGIQQRVATGLTVGYDLNTNRSASVYYSSSGTSSNWLQSTLGGALMMRPVFGAKVPTPVGINENTLLNDRSVYVYPNPASDELTVHCDKAGNLSYFLMNTLGQVLQQDRILFNEQAINTAALGNGVYFLVIKENNRLVQQQKIIIQH